VDLVIRALDRKTLGDAYGFDDVFLVESELILSVAGRGVRYEVVRVPAYEKSYLSDDLSGHLDHPEKAVFLAYLDGNVAGRVVLSVGWNRYTWIDDIAVDKRSRRAGVGRALMDQTVAWTNSLGLPGIRAETQNNNVPACNFYEACGFRLGGFDMDLYRGLDLMTKEVALFWYRHIR
jgi:streptothricin acetyltransferase